MHDEDHVVHFLVKQFEAEPRIYWNLETFQWKNHKLYQFVNGTTLEKKRRFWILCNAIISTKKFFLPRDILYHPPSFLMNPLWLLVLIKVCFFFKVFLSGAFYTKSKWSRLKSCIWWCIRKNVCKNKVNNTFKPFCYEFFTHFSLQQWRRIHGSVHD